MKGSDHVLNLANITEPLDRTDTECFNGQNLEVAAETTNLIHRIGPELMTDKIVLVDPDRCISRTGSAAAVAGNGDD
jgi:hypothetical protein